MVSFSLSSALEECFYMYRWALCNVDRLGTTGQHVCVAGDSAGGNLVAAVTLRCIMEVCCLCSGSLCTSIFVNARDH